MGKNLAANVTETILDSIADGVFTVDPEWRITSFNRSAEIITGVPRSEAVGQHCCDVFHSNICETGCALRETLETRKPVVNKSIYIIDAEGRRIPISISTAILKDSEGNVLGGVETFRDLSTVEELRRELQGKYTFEDMIGRSDSMHEIFHILPQVAEHDTTVLIEGASGTGKELLARAIHNLSPRKDGPFVAINCAAVPDTLLESELFGYKAGAFTGADRDKPGRFAVADGGTIFLDEIGDISPAMQARLLRTLQERTIEPLGGVKTISVNVRVVAATNKDLARLVRKGDFRQDLYYRIKVVTFHLPLLKDRREDIPLLIDHFVQKFNRLQNKEIDGVSNDVMAILMNYDYPGNVRELENILEHGFVLSSTRTIEVKHLPPALRPNKGDFVFQISRGGSLKEIEAKLIQDAVRRNGGNRNAAARELGIHPSTLFRKVKAMGIELPNKDGRSGD